MLLPGLRTAPAPPITQGITLLPSTTQPDLPLVFLISGDGGWNDFSQGVGSEIARLGMPVIGLDAKKYFWKGVTPEKTTEEISATILKYLQVWNRKSFVLAGYSFGGCLMPFIAGRMPNDLKEQMKAVVAVSADEKADFEIHIADMLGVGSKKSSYDVPAELKKIKDMHPVCLFGKDESSATIATFNATGAKVVVLPGGHHYNNNYALVAKTIRESF